MQLIATKPTISAEAAAFLVAAAIAEAAARKLEICAAVVDPNGFLIAFQRTENVMIASVEIAMDKAFTAALLKDASAALAQKGKEQPKWAAGLASRNRMVVWPGGVPLKHGDTIIGGIGISGAPDEDDVAIAEAVILKLLTAST